MPPTQDPKLLALLLWGTFALVGLLLTVLAFLIRQALAAQTKTLERLDAAVQQLARTVDRHEERLTSGGGEFAAHRRRLEGLEERERTRACFGRCTVGGA